MSPITEKTATIADLQVPDSFKELADNTDSTHPVLGYSYDWASSMAFEISHHTHARAQVVYATTGILQVGAKDAMWSISPQQALWVPPAVEHELRATGAFGLRTIYIHPDIARKLPSYPCVIAITRLLKELILYAAHMESDYLPRGYEAQILSAIPAVLNTINPMPIQLLVPTDPRLQSMVKFLFEQPADTRPLGFWAETTGASERTMLRQFIRETGMSYKKWRSHLKLVHAMALLSKGVSVTSIAYTLGYNSPSAFVSIFRREMGQSPARYISSCSSKKSGNKFYSKTSGPPQISRLV